MLFNLDKIFISRYISIKQNDEKYININTKEIQNRIYAQQKNMPDFLFYGLNIIIILFLTYNFFTNFFSINIGSKQISNARKSKFLPFKKLIRFYDSLFEMANVKETLIKNFPNPNIININNNLDFIIIGSGPGGAISAQKLLNAGFKTCIIESGRINKNYKMLPFSYNEMIHHYKHSGISATMGNVNIAYVEGATLGGGSEVNSGLYHRTPNDILIEWNKKYGLIDSDKKNLDKYFKILEKELCISYSPHSQIPKPALALRDGANKLGWNIEEVPRWFKYSKSESVDDIKMTMSQTYLKNYLDNGGLVLESSKAKTIRKCNKKWYVSMDTFNGKKEISSKNVILSAGAIGTPQILNKSGISKLAGKQLQMHPTIKIVALFDEKINQSNMGVPAHQVNEFGPEILFGCSISSKPYLHLAMLDHPGHKDIVNNMWQNMAIFYAMIKPQGTGSIKNLPFFNDPLITYNLTKHDKTNLSIGLKQLSKLLISSGAQRLFPSINNGPIISNINEIDLLPNSIDTSKTSLMTVHLFSSCPIGEKENICVANSYGQIFDNEGLFISDASMLPSAPGVNPQGTIMAFAHRNIDKIITCA